MKVRLSILCTVLCAAVCLQAQIRRVPDDYGTIQEAVNAAEYGDTVLVAAGTYYENIIIRGKHITVASLYLTTGDTSYISRTVIDGSAAGRTVSILSGADSSAQLSGFTVTNGSYASGAGIYIYKTSARVSHCIIRDNHGDAYNPMGGGIFLREARSFIHDCLITENTALGADIDNGWGGGIGVSGGAAEIVNCTVTGNQTTSAKAGIGGSNTNIRITGCLITGNRGHSAAGAGFQDAQAEIINSTIACNHGGNSQSGGVYFIRSSPVFQNSIVWYNTTASGFRNLDGWGGEPEFYHSNIQGGYLSLDIMDADPLFADTSSADFRLTAGSPCIDAGTPDTTGLRLPLKDIGGADRIQDGDGDGTAVVDIGAYEYEPGFVSVPERAASAPVSFRLEQNYPNPFNAETVLFFTLPKQASVRLQVFTVLGEETAVLADGVYAAGSHQVRWKAENLPSGVYLCRLKTDEGVRTIRMLLQR